MAAAAYIGILSDQKEKRKQRIYFTACAKDIGD